MHRRLLEPLLHDLDRHWPHRRLCPRRPRRADHQCRSEHLADPHLFVPGRRLGHGHHRGPGAHRPRDGDSSAPRPAAPSAATPRRDRSLGCRGKRLRRADPKSPPVAGGGRDRRGRLSCSRTLHTGRRAPRAPEHPPGDATMTTLLAVSPTGLVSGAEVVLRRITKRAETLGWGATWAEPRGEESQRPTVAGAVTVPLPAHTITDRPNARS